MEAWKEKKVLQCCGAAVASSFELPVIDSPDALFVLNGRKNMVVHVKRWVNSELTLFKSQIDTETTKDGHSAQIQLGKLVNV